MTLADLRSATQAVSPSQLDQATTDGIINRVYRAYLRKKKWIATRSSSILATQADKTGGTITLANGSTSVTGTGTAFTASDVGRYLYVGAYVLARIATFVAPSGVGAITLTSPWGGPVQTNVSLQVTSLRYALPSGTERVSRIATDQWPQGLGRVSRQAIDAYDPTRRWRGSPMVWAEAEIVAGVKEIELWPVPTVQDALDLTVLIRPDSITTLAAAGDVPLVDGVMLQYGSMAEASRMLLARTGDQTWAESAKLYQDLADDAAGEAMREDSAAKGLSRVVSDSDDGLTDLSQFSSLRQFEAFFQTF